MVYKEPISRGNAVRTVMPIESIASPPIGTCTAKPPARSVA